MFSKKTRNLTVAVLALIMALTLTFGLLGFNTMQVNAATIETVFDGYNGTSVPSDNETWSSSDNTVQVNYNDNSGATDYDLTGSVLSGSYKCIKYNGQTKTTYKRYVSITVVAGTEAKITAYVTAGNTGKYIDFLDSPDKPTSGVKVTKSKECYSLNFSTTGSETANTTKYLCGSDSWQLAKITVEITPVVKEFTVSYDLAGGTGATGVDYKQITWKKEMGEIATLAAPKKEGYNFAGWKVDTTTTIYKAGDKFTPTANTKLIAQWTPIATQIAVVGETTGYTVFVNQTFDTKNLPQQATISTADKAETTTIDLRWELKSGNTTAVGNEVVYNALFDAPTGWALAEGLTVQPITVTVVADPRPTVTGLTLENNSVLVEQNATYNLPAQLNGTLSDGTTTLINVEWDKAVDTSNAGRTTYTAKPVSNANTTYQVEENTAVKAELELKVRGIYNSTFSASWDISKVEPGITWNGEKTLDDATTTEYTLAKAQGITINTAVGTVADAKSTDTFKSELENCVKANAGKDLFVITVPAGMKGKIKILAACYSTSKVPGLKLNGGDTQKPTEGEYSVTAGKDADKVALTDNDIITHSCEFIFEFDANKDGTTYTITNDSGSGNNIYASSVEVSFDVTSSRHYFFAGETFGEIAVDGYVFIGWTSADANDTTLYKDTETEVATAPADGDYYAILAKLEYLGVSFRLNVDYPGVRYGFILKFYDLSDDPESKNSLRTDNLTHLNIDVTHITFTVTRGDTTKQTATVKFDDTTLASEFSETYMGYVSNLVIMGIPAADCNQTMKVDAKFTITIGENTFTRDVFGAEANISEKATEAYNQGEFGIKDTPEAKALAAKYGVTVA